MTENQLPENMTIGSVPSDFIDKELTCINGHKFTYTAEEQAFFANHQPPWLPPKRCIPCRKANKIKYNRRPIRKTFVQQ
jgi:hypothetical protein